MFDIHKIKPVHGWREFFGEVGIIVLGVLIALAAESLVERWRWHEETEQNREAIKRDLYASALNAWERLGVEPCLRGRLSDLLARVDANRGDWKSSPMPRRPERERTTVVSPAYAPPSRYYLTDAWKDALASGSFQHLSADDAANFSVAFSSVQEMADAQAREASAATRLSPLSFNLRLDARSKIDMIAAIAEVDRSLLLMDAVSAELLDNVRGLKLGFDPQMERRDRAAIFADQRYHRGFCVVDPHVAL